MEKKSLIVINAVSARLKKANIDFKNQFPNNRILNWDSPDTDIAGLIKNELQREYFDELIVAGGDGTINRVAGSIINSEVTLGIIPLGSGNGLARHLGIPLNTEGAIKIIHQGFSRKIDACTINENTFFCTAGVGFDALVGHRFAKSKTRGFWTYFRITSTQFFKYKPEEFELFFEGRTISGKAFVVTFANANQYGNNAFIAPLADLSDGKIDVTIVKPFNLFNSPFLAYDLFAKKIHRNKNVITFRSENFRLNRNSSGIGQFDGEPVSFPAEFSVVNLPSALNVYSKG